MIRLIQTGYNTEIQLALLIFIKYQQATAFSTIKREVSLDKGKRGK